MNSFLTDIASDASCVVQRCSDLANETAAAFQTVVTKYGLSASAKLDETISVVASFVVGLEKCRKDNLREDKMRQMAEKRKATKARPMQASKVCWKTKREKKHASHHKINRLLLRPPSRRCAFRI